MCVHVYLFEIDALATGVWPSQQFHATMLAVKAAVIRNKRTHAQFLQGVSGGNTGHVMWSCDGHVMSDDVTHA